LEAYRSETELRFAEMLVGSASTGCTSPTDLHWNATTSHPSDSGSIVLPRDFGHPLLQVPSKTIQIAKKLDTVAALNQIGLEH
jgi:hypothetical protein